MYIPVLDPEFYQNIWYNIPYLIIIHLYSKTIKGPLKMWYEARVLCTNKHYQLFFILYESETLNLNPEQQAENLACGHRCPGRTHLGESIRL